MACSVVRASNSRRMGTSIKKAATKKCPEPQQGSSSLSSASVLGQSSKLPAANAQPPSSSLTKRRNSKGTPGMAASWRNSSSLAAFFKSSALKRRAAHHAPNPLSNKKLTMYGSVKSWVTAGSSRAPILTSALLMRSLLSACQNWYTQPRLSEAEKTSCGKAASRRSSPC